MTRRSDSYFAQYVEANQRFDYYVTGFTGALTAYVGKSLEPVRLGLKIESLYFYAFCFLLVSVILGFRRIETLVTVMSDQHQTVAASEDADTAAAASLRPWESAVSAGRVVRAWDSKRRAELLRELVDELDKSLDKLSDQAAAEYKWRNRTLLLGAGILALARMLPAYVS